MRTDRTGALLHSGHERVPVRSRRADGRAARSPRWLGAHLRDVGVRPRAGHRAADARLLGVRPHGVDLRSARRRRARRARPGLPRHRADPVEPAGRGALRARHDRRRLPLAAHHDLRGALQPDEAQPRRRARPRPHHPGRAARRRSGAARVPAGAGRRDPDDGSHLRRAPERDHRREGLPLRRARSRRHRHRGPAARAAGASPMRRSRRSCSRRARPAWA